MRRAQIYFDRPGFRRPLKAVWKKYVSLGRIGGQAVVEHVSEAECEALNSFFGWDFRPGDSVPIPLRLFDQELRESAFAISMLQLHSMLEGTPLLTKSERMLGYGRRWRSLFAKLRETESGSFCRLGEEWLTLMEQGAGAGYRTLRECYNADPDNALMSLRIVMHALNQLFEEQEGVTNAQIRMPVLAARASGDAHALDLDRPAGRMLIAALRSKVSDIPFDEESSDGIPDRHDGSATLKLREFYRQFGILDDDLSSIVHWFIPESDKPIVPTVWTLRQVDAEERFPRCSRIYVVENPAVFSAVLDSIRQPVDHSDHAPPALICTSGPASSAAIRWIQRCLEASGPKCQLYYSGDFDVKGLLMGQSLYRMFPEQFAAWRFDVETYQAASLFRYPGPSFDENEMEKLNKMKVPWDERLCEIMRQTGRKAHQESFVEKLIEDYMLYVMSDSLI
ncbi:DUF2399 domain-containing protein [Cohnella pontilimi]|uniref:DUF2399 domain-containing protein n=2 Tax=Cohnella pontilimi TaxID=2564100 RepID=A0A4U0FDX1_9BACL|nr:DUF2399 domain-containing protein [Cohnella pontilimi]